MEHPHTETPQLADDHSDRPAKKSTATRYIMQSMRERRLSFVVSVFALAIGGVAVLGGVLTPTEASNKHGCSVRENTANAIIRGGTCTPDELIQKYNADKKKGGDLRAIYNHYGLNINSFKNAKPGSVDRAGTITVDGKVVAKNAYTMGRQNNRPNSKPVKIDGKTYYQRANNAGQYGKNQPVMVVFDKYGRFQNAVINACANPLLATATQPKPVASCDSLTAKAVSRTKFQFNTKASAKNGAHITGYTFDFGDGTKQKVKTASPTHEYKKAGTYNVIVTVHTNIGDKTAAKCKTSVTVKPAPVNKIEVCEIESGKIIEIDEKKFDDKKHSKNLADCEKIEVCELTSGTIIEIRKPEFDEKKHSEDLSDCEKIEVCEVKTGNIVTIEKKDFDEATHSKDLKDCEPEETPVVETPDELPETGLGDSFVRILGLGAMTASIVYFYVSSRRS